MSHQVSFVPSGRTLLVSDGETILDAARRASEPISAECSGRGACGRCLVRIVEGDVPEYRVLRRDDGRPEVLACVTPVKGPLTVLPIVEADPPHLVSRDRNTGILPLSEWAPWPLALDPIHAADQDGALGVAIDIGTTTLRLLVIRLADGVVVGGADAYNPQIPRGADVVSRIVAAEKGMLGELALLIRQRIADMVMTATGVAEVDDGRIRAYMVAGNVTMMHLLLEQDPSGIRRVPSEPLALAFAPVMASALGWPGGTAPVYSIPAAGGWVGGDIVAGIVRAGLSRASEHLTLYVDLGTNGEIAFGGSEFALACACSAGPAFEGTGIRCGMRADRGAIDGGRVIPDEGLLELSVIGGVRPRGVCGSGLIALTHALLSAGWIDRAGRITELLPERYRLEGHWGTAIALDERRKIGLWERDLSSLMRAKAAIFAGIRSLTSALGDQATNVDRVIVSGNFGRYLNLPAAIGIGLLPQQPFGHYSYVDNGALEGAALALLSREFLDEVGAYLTRITYVDLCDIPGYMDEFVGASFLPHTDPSLLRL